MIIKSCLAGLSIGLGGILYILMQYLSLKLNILNLTELFKFIGSCLFSIGLLIICTFKLNLYTGKIGLILEQKRDVKEYLSLILILIINLISSGTMGLGCHYLFNLIEPSFVAIACNITNKRIELNNVNDYVNSFINSCLCGACVYSAVKGFQRYKLLLTFFISWFVYCGFEHCIADSFYYCFANIFKYKAFISLIINIVGNTIGVIPVIYAYKIYDNESNSATSV